MSERRCLRGAEVLVGREWHRRDLWIEADGMLGAPAPGRPHVVVDCSGLRLVPGLIDLQINGGWGLDVQTEPESLWELGARLASVGVTGFLPTLTTNGYGLVDRALDALASGPPPGWVGATPLGWHLEGPWINPERAGAHDVAQIQPPRDVPSRIAAREGVSVVTLAPEVPAAGGLIEELAERGVVVSLGHSAATSDQAWEAFATDATMGTHLFNAMGGLHHRHPGLAAALLDEHSHA